MGESQKRWNTLVDMLRDRSADGGYVPYSWLNEGDASPALLSAAELDRRARAAAVVLAERVRPGDRALLLFPPGLDYIVAIFACFYAGVIAVPAYPPDPKRLARTLPRLIAIVRGSGARIALTTEAIRVMSGALGEFEPALTDLSWIASDTCDVGGADHHVGPVIQRETVAFLQYTSGSTASPRGVILTHGALLENLSAIYSGFGSPASTRGVCWLPPYHDMGLIGGILSTLYCNAFTALMSPLLFLKRPAQWLRAISQHRAEVSGGPNFAYEMCVQRVDPDKEALDLSSWRVACNGAEVVRHDTLRRFGEKFGRVGFKRSAFFPCYGLAEATLLVTAGPVGREPVVATVEAHTSEGRGGGSANGAPAQARALVSSGRVVAGVELAIVDAETHRTMPDGKVGEIWLRGPSMGLGYWDLPEETQRTFRARIEGQEDREYMRSGDLGFLANGELFVVGRVKDLIVIRGRNLFPDDIEQVAVLAHESLRAGGTAAFAIEVSNEEHLAVAQEVTQGDIDLPAVQSAIRRAVGEAFDVIPREVILLRPGSLPKTSSGKVQRHACRAAYRDGTFERAQ